MKLFDIPPFNHEQRDSSLRDQMIERLRQINDGFYTETEMNRMSDYALLCAFEKTMSLIGYSTSSDNYNDGFSDGHVVGRKYEQNMSNTITQGVM
jgi:hypothetical protein